jgi:hypothetical protein
LFAAACTCSPPAFGPAPPVRGVALGLHQDRPEIPHAARLVEIRRLGATHVSLVVHWSQRDVTSHDIGPHPADAVADGTVEDAVDAAHRAGLRVLLFPILQIRERAPGDWRGTLRPLDLDAWFEAYARFVLHYTRIAAAKGVAMFSVGSELLSTERRREAWARLIHRVRAAYRGEIVYSANWDHYRPVTFWDLVDRIGVNGYFEVAGEGGDSVEAMRAAWGPVRERLADFAARRGKPLLLTEVGYPSVREGARSPWHHGRVEPVDVAEQSRAYRAFIEAWAGDPALSGVFVWNWVGDGGPDDPGYTPRGKPAERLLRAWFSGK